MAITEENGNGFYMPVAPAYGVGNGGFGNGFGGDWGWIILLLLCANGGWGGFGGFGGMGGFAADGAMLYPWMNQAEITTQGFQNAQLGNQLTAVQSDLGDIQTQLCNGFAGIEQGANARQIANMQQAFASQAAITGAISDLASQQANCCCENRLATCQTQNVIAREAADTRYANANNTQTLLSALTSGVQSIKDQLCQDKIDAKNDEIAQLRQEVLFARGQASQDNQTAILRQSDATTANQLVQELRSCPIPAMPVYGQTPIFTCNNNGCGCGCGSF